MKSYIMELSCLHCYLEELHKLLRPNWCSARNSCSPADGTASQSTGCTQTWRIHCRCKQILQDKDVTDVRWYTSCVEVRAAQMWTYEVVVLIWKTMNIFECHSPPYWTAAVTLLVSPENRSSSLLGNPWSMALLTSS